MRLLLWSLIALANTAVAGSPDLGTRLAQTLRDLRDLRGAARIRRTAGVVLATLLGVSAHAADAARCRVATYAYGDLDRGGALAPLAVWLQAQGGCDWDIEVLASPVELAEALLAGRVDWALPNLVGYLHARAAAPQRDSGLRVAVPAVDAHRYRSALVARRGQVEDLDALRQQASSLRLGLSFPDSASGALVPRALLAQAGLDSERDFAVRRYTGGHADSLKALVAGHLDVVGVPLGVLPEPPGDDLVLLAVSAPIPVGPMLCGERLAARCADLAEALRTAPEAESIARALAAAWPEYGAARGLERVPPAEYSGLPLPQPPERP